VSFVGQLEHGESLSSNHVYAIPSFGFFLYHCLSMNYMLRNSKSWLFWFLFVCAFQKMLLHYLYNNAKRGKHVGDNLSRWPHWHHKNNNSKKEKHPIFVSNITTMKPTKKRSSITLNFERPNYLKSHAPPHHSHEFIAKCLWIWCILVKAYWSCIADDVEDGGCAKCKQSWGLGSKGPKIPISFNDAQNMQHSSEVSFTTCSWWRGVSVYFTWTFASMS
jgi:hypothetical protein